MKIAALPIAFAMLLPLVAGCHHQLLQVSTPVTPPEIQKAQTAPLWTDQNQKDYDEDAAHDSSLGDAKRMRDTYIYNVMAAIDADYGVYVSRLYTGKSTESVLADSLTLGLSAASTIATHTPTKTILSALGTAASGLQLSIDKNFFAQQTFQVIAIAMQTRRDAFRAAITENVKLDVKAYPLAQARRDLVVYFYAGTLPAGLQQLQEEAGAQTAKNTAKSQQQVEEHKQADSGTANPGGAGPAGAVQSGGAAPGAAVFNPRTTVDGQEMPLEPPPPAAASPAPASNSPVMTPH